MSETPPPGPAEPLSREALRARIDALAAAVDAQAEHDRARIEAVPQARRASATNLAHYLGLRRQDVRRLQLELAAQGLSSLGRCEGHVRDTLRRLAGWLGGGAPAAEHADALDRPRAERLLHDNAHALFGPRPADRHVFIMVTAPDALDATPQWADALLAAGTDVLRINGAHETPQEWAAIVSVFRARAKALGRAARVFVDLPGPKLRGDVPGRQPAVLHFPRHKDRNGRTIAPTVVELVARYTGGAQLPVPPAWLERMRTGDAVTFTDAGGRRRRLTVREMSGGRVRAECARSLWLAAGLPLAWRRGRRVLARGALGRLPSGPRTLMLERGGTFLLNDSGRRGPPRMPRVHCPEPGLLANVRVGERVVLDDGRIVAAVESAGPEGLVCRVLQAVKSPIRLRSGKGIAFPDSTLPVRGLGAADDAALGFALEHADGVGVSFVNSAADVTRVGERVRAAGRADFGVILKLETRGAMRNLPAILYEALRFERVGLMIARGDLAVELSFERLAEMQEELLWFAEAAHLPVVWATQVLDTLAHTGVPTRAEVTDAAMAMRAECVMLNKGPYVAQAVKTLVDIIRKMEMHQFKKRSLFRPLALALDAVAPDQA